ncbi:hypothetical protein [Parasitella parasitica]|uniref:Uncharacterized protein n=1 Tax=Parasitella parasitica TaxID=35722 RepID=A0A0B7NWZ1_9FUNG|nr:hypothetical protein [Parasitella parasitica]
MHLTRLLAMLSIFLVHLYTNLLFLAMPWGLISDILELLAVILDMSIDILVLTAMFFGKFSGTSIVFTLLSGMFINLGALPCQLLGRFE